MYSRLGCFLFLWLAFSFFSCQREALYADLEKLSGTGVIPIDSDRVRGVIGEVFSQYIYVETPNGQRVNIFGTQGVQEEQMEYAKEILLNYFSTSGEAFSTSQKEIIMNSMGNRKCALVFFEDEEEFEEHIVRVSLSGFNVQDLYASESLNSGNRDASYEEILHLVHNYGIAPTLFIYQDRLQKACDVAIESGLYSPPDDLPKADFDDEYFAALMDCYLGLWEGTDGTMDGEYRPSSKGEMLMEDPEGYQLVRDLFGDIQRVH